MMAIRRTCRLASKPCAGRYCAFCCRRAILSFRRSGNEGRTVCLGGHRVCRLDVLVRPRAKGRLSSSTEFRNEERIPFGMTTRENEIALRKVLACFNKHHSEATCQSGYGAVCKTVYPGSIPGVASIKSMSFGVAAHFRRFS